MDFEALYMSLKKNQRSIFEFILNDRATDLTIPEIARHLKISSRTVDTNLKFLSDHGLVMKFTGVNRNCNQYVVPKRVKESYDLFIENAIKFIGLR